jgi:hypothetical protein
MTGHIVEIAPRRATAQATPPGHQVYREECFRCHRDFRVYVPDGQAFGILVLDVPRPHCHRFRAEVRVEHAELPVLVEPTQRSWVGWRVRRARQVARIVRRTTSIRGGSPFVRSPDGSAPPRGACNGSIAASR